MHSLEENPKKGEPLGNVGGVVIKELKYKKFRFCFITNGYKLKVMDKSDLSDLLIKFIRMSKKKDQQETIKEVKKILLHLNPEEFN